MSDFDYDDFIEALFDTSLQSRPVCNECAGTGEDCGLRCLACDGWGYKQTAFSSQHEGTTALTWEMLARAFYGEFS